MSTTTTEPGATAAGPVWHTLSVSDALQHEEVDPTKGLSPAEAETRLQKFGPNAFAQRRKNRDGAPSCASSAIRCRSSSW